ncbi:hypothetical protein [Leptodesmis sichuanensis]|uniref:hypothetical protein n=1 Tax=Leptodesmis sichuanensis TaxID=2906798 RepID=UPI001F1707A5|nr:hypothetical protein [Leptodesmis sichuanensis]UIE36386.1 hypothetical protein KIK02_15135 [Leptodesmis sichuanensis A121]
MYDNKIRLSQDVLDKAEIIAQAWGLKNARAAVEAVFRKYADEYLHRSSNSFSAPQHPLRITPPPSPSPTPQPPSCEALNELDELLGL